MSPTVPTPIDETIRTVAAIPSQSGAAGAPLTAGEFAVVVAVTGAGLAILGGIVAYVYRSSDERVDRVADALGGELPAPTDAPIREDADVPTAAHLHEVATDADGDPVYVPVIRVPLATDDPGIDGVYRHTADAAAALHEEFDDAHVRGYDVEFGLDDSSLGGVGRTVKRVAVTPELAERLRDPGYDHRDLRADVAAGDDGDPGVPPVDWGEALNYGTGDGSAAAGAAATTAAT
ncbi:hypothetical protein ABNG03_00065 [Halorubrum sp. RMP-47]|uniref:Uncharacterized protein n=1 Tax=Halorubrum miltondacostae TaxID=3076378 RepID=A0ABD5M3Y9_9EURY